MFFRIMRSRLAGRAAGFQNCGSRARTTWCTGVRGRAQVAWQLQDIPSKRAKAALPLLIRGYATKETSRTQIEQEMAQIQRRIRRSYLHCEYDDALGYAEMLNKMSNEYFGIKHPVYAASLNNLGLLNKSLGRFDIAIDFYSQAVDTYQKTVGHEHASTATAIHNVGVAFKDMAESSDNSELEKFDLYTKAEEVLNESLELRRIVLPPNHADTATSLSVLAMVKNYLEKDDEAIEIMLESIEIFREHMEKNKFVVPAGLTAINNLGYMYKLRGNYEMARKYYLEALEGRKEYFGKENKNTLITMNNLLLLERDNNNLEEAEKYEEEINDIMSKIPMKG